MNRGGSWNNSAENCRSANRNNNTPDNRNDNIGFRLALSPVHQRMLMPNGRNPAPAAYVYAAGQKGAARPVLVPGLDDQAKVQAGHDDSLRNKRGGVSAEGTRPKGRIHKQQ